jgi:hypothetical protein
MIVVNLDQARAEAIDVWDRAQLYKDASDQQLSAEMALAAAENRPNDYFPRLAALLERAQYPELLHQSREQFVALAFPQIVRMHIAHEQAHVQAIEEGYISSELNETGQKVVGETFAGLGALLYGGMPYVAVEEIINWGAMMPGTAYGEAGANIINSLIIEFLNHRKDYPSIDFVVPSDLSNRQIAQFFMSQFPHLTEAKFLLAGGLIREAIIRALREKKLGLLQKRPRTHFAQSVLAAV